MYHEIQKPNPELIFTEEDITRHIEELEAIALNSSKESVDQREEELSEEYRRASYAEDEARRREVSQQLHGLQYARNHGAAAEQYMYNMERHPNKMWCNDDTEFGQRIGVYVEAAPAPLEQHFVPFSDHRIVSILGEEAPSITYERLIDQEPLHIPATAFISVPRFEYSWREGRGTQSKVEESSGLKDSSSAIIEKYAAMPQETAPAVEAATGLLQPDGTIVYISRNAAHRVAAAVLRGDETIAVREVTLIRVNEQIV